MPIRNFRVEEEGQCGKSIFCNRGRPPEPVSAGGNRSRCSRFAAVTLRTGIHRIYTCIRFLQKAQAAASAQEELEAMERQLQKLKDLERVAKEEEAAAAAAVEEARLLKEAEELKT